MRKKFLIKLLIFLILFLLIDNGIFLILKKGLDKYYGFGKNSEILIIGSSVSIAGYYIPLLQSALNMKVALYAQIGASLELRYVMLNHFLKSNTGKVKIVLYEVSPIMLSYKGLATNGYKLLYPYMEDSVINNYIVTKEARLSNYIMHKYIKTSRFDNHLLKYSFLGYLGFYSNVKNLIIDTATIAKLRNKERLEHILLDSLKIKTIEQSIHLIHENNAHTILINFPMTNFLKNSYFKDDYDQYLSFLQGLVKKFPDVSFIDLNINEFNDYHMFSDEVHLNTKGQKKFTEAICSELKQLRCIYPFTPTQ